MMNDFRRSVVVFFSVVVGMMASAGAQTASPPSRPLKPPTSQPTTRPVQAITHVVIISIDGCRPDLLLRANTPVIHSILPHASFTFWAKTTAESITLPSHVSMLTGVIPLRHAIQWNTDLALKEPVYPKFSTLFEVAKHYGFTTAMAAGKNKFDTLAVPGSLDEQFVPTKDKIEDPQVTDAAVGFIREHQPQVLFVHLPSDDNTGHKDGWGSPEQLAVIARADTCIGRIIKAIDEANLKDSTAVIITADHGGFGHEGHGPDDPRCRYIPWICYGPGIRENLDLTTLEHTFTDENAIVTEDTFCTACYLLGIPMEKDLNGRPVTGIIRRDELLQSK